MRRSILVLLLALCSLCLEFKAQGASAVVCGGAPAIRYVQLRKVTYLYLRDVAKFYGMSCKIDDKEITLTSSYTTIKLTEKSRIMLLNGVKVHLSRPVSKMGRTYLFSKSDFSNILEPILRKNTLPRKKISTIVIDAGHGGKDVGAIGDKNVYEKNINLQVAKRLAKKLQEHGFHVCMTRSKDKDMGLEDRTKFSNACQADAFISLHCNSASSAVSGLEIYIATPFGDPATGDEYISKETCVSNNFNTSNAYLAYFAQRSILQRTGMEDRGVRRRRFYVVRNVSAPCMLVEMGFMSNATELKQLQAGQRQEQIAEALADTVVRFRDASASK